MTDIVNTFLLTGNKLISDIQLRQPGFTCSACRLFTKNKKRMQKFKETRKSRYIY